MIENWSFLFNIQTFDRCNALGLAQSQISYRRMLDDQGDGLVELIKEMVQEGQELHITFDNFDFLILTNIVKGYQNSDMHWITEFITFDRISSAHLNDSRPLIQDLNDFDNINYLLSKMN